MGGTIKFNACKELDFSEKYSADKVLISLGEKKVCWSRHVFDGEPRLIQFCKLRGRLNNPEMCTSKKTAQCSDYEDFKHKVKLKTINIGGKENGCR